ncbi:SHIRT domain-containing protein, partial [uncultured Granulicatella sp.]|uniref:SHIRT domain-containing protein n=1 Tax=uncultured Granulicatella sp. TaxID=316089 RepID=UPI00262106F1
TAGKALPAGLNALLPTDPTKYIMNDTVTALAPAQTTFADDVLDGVWTFQGYDADTKVVGKENVTFIAKWTFKSNEYTVSYESKSETPGKEVPEALKGLLPTDPAKYIMNDTVTAKAPSKTTYADDVLDGVWTFEGYDSATKLVGKENVKFFAKWSFVANKYKATYEFVSGTDGKVLPSSVLANLPEDVTEYINGQTVTAIKPATLTVQDPENNGTWTFVGYTEDSKVINKEGVKFVGTWTFKENDPELPNTGTASELGALSATIGAIFAGFGVSILRKKDSKDKA